MERKRILICDDSCYVRKTLGMYFQANGIEVITARDGDECVTKAEAYLPDLIVLDINMHHTNGLDTSMVLKMSPGIRHIPVIIFSAFLTRRVLSILKEAGIEEYVEKPCKYEVLLNAIHNILARQGKTIAYTASGSATSR